jgi:hypothetical protein
MGCSGILLNLKQTINIENTVTERNRTSDGVVCFDEFRVNVDKNENDM